MKKKKKHLSAYIDLVNSMTDPTDVYDVYDALKSLMQTHARVDPKVSVDYVNGIIDILKFIIDKKGVELKSNARKELLEEVSNLIARYCRSDSSTDKAFLSYDITKKVVKGQLSTDSKILIRKILDKLK